MAAKQSKTAPKEYIRAVGRRKSATAVVKLVKTKGTITVNNRPLDKYFPTLELQRLVEAPLAITNLLGAVQITGTTKGGGWRGQAEAVRLAISRAIAKLDPAQSTALRARDLLTRDAREKERKKFGLKKARRAPQWGKR